MLIPADIDTLPAGTFVYSRSRLPLGVIRDYLAANGNYRPHLIRHLDNGKPEDRFAYRRAALYRAAKEAGVLIAATKPASTDTELHSHPRKTDS